MSDMQYNLQFDKLCKVLKLGDIVGAPKPISGGFHTKCMLSRQHKENMQLKH